MIRHVRQSDHDTEKSKHMHDQKDSFNSGKQSSADQIDEQSTKQGSPNNQCTMPWQGIIKTVSQDRSTLDHRPGQEGGRCKGGLPAKNGPPAYFKQVLVRIGDEKSFSFSNSLDLPVI